MTTSEPTVFLIDIDNTLIDNDRIQDDLRTQLQSTLDAAECTRYWEIFETLREQLGYADYLGSLQHLRRSGVNDQPLLQLSTFLLDYPFAERVYKGAAKALGHLRQWGQTVILSDGDVVLQPRKIQRSGLWQAVEGRVLIYIHKEHMLEQVVRAYPAHHYVMIEDKLRILSAMKAIWGDRLTTIFVRQGHYGLDHQANAKYAPADLSFERIEQLIDYSPLSRS